VPAMTSTDALGGSADAATSTPIVNFGTVPFRPTLQSQVTRLSEVKSWSFCHAL
jgi:hypothetical protein